MVRRAVLTANAPTRFKVLRIFGDLGPDGDACSDPALVKCSERTIDGLEFSAPKAARPGYMWHFHIVGHEDLRLDLRKELSQRDHDFGGDFVAAVEGDEGHGKARGDKVGAQSVGQVIG
jgi:hypothetical protein